MKRTALTSRAATTETASSRPRSRSRPLPAAEQETGGTAGEVEPAEQADPVEDPNDLPTPNGAAYEVEVSKGNQELKVFLDSSFNPIDTQVDAG